MKPWDYDDDESLFRVEQDVAWVEAPPGEGHGVGNLMPVWKETFTVSMPHQCDAWTITEYAEKATAIAEMEEFVWRAQGALEKLRAWEVREPGTRRDYEKDPR